MKSREIYEDDEASSKSVWNEKQPELAVIIKLVRIAAAGLAEWSERRNAA